MFGYITIDQDELKGKDQRKYREYYCGVCRDIKKRSGQLPRAFLTYDMTFLAILLSSLSEDEEQREKKRCCLHPVRKTESITNRWTQYAADMNVLLVYHNLMDDWLDEKKLNSRMAAGLMKGTCRKLEELYPHQSRAIATYLEALHKTEQENSPDIDRASGLTGVLMGNCFLPLPHCGNRSLEPWDFSWESGFI